MVKPYTIMDGEHYQAHLCQIAGVKYVDIFNKTYNTHISRHVNAGAGQIYCRALLARYDNAPAFESLSHD